MRSRKRTNNEGFTILDKGVTRLSRIKDIKPVLKHKKNTLYTLVSDAVMSGLLYGYRRAHKHIDNPSSEDVIEKMHQEVLNELCNVVEFSEDE